MSVMANSQRQCSSTQKLGRQLSQTQPQLSLDLPKLPAASSLTLNKKDGVHPRGSAQRQMLLNGLFFLHTRNCLCSLTARSCKWKINNSMSCRRRNNATLHQTGPCFTVSLESVLHERTALPFGLYILLMWMHIYGVMDQPILWRSILSFYAGVLGKGICPGCCYSLCAVRWLLFSPQTITLHCLGWNRCCKGALPVPILPNMFWEPAVNLYKVLNVLQSLDWYYILKIKLIPN